jgi:hypothetical protein
MESKNAKEKLLLMAIKRQSNNLFRDCELGRRPVILLGELLKSE